MITRKGLFFKRIFDIIGSFIGLVVLLIPLVVLILCASVSFKEFGLFSQTRVGQEAKLFSMYKIKSMRSLKLYVDPKLRMLDKFGITVKGDERVTTFGLFLRKYKLDEVPQLFNVLIGDMSFVGPRPDIIGYADKLTGNERIILRVKPGITGPATIAFRNEELLLSKSTEPITYNNEVLWPQKVKLNMDYVQNWSFKKDLNYIFETIFN